MHPQQNPYQPAPAWQPPRRWWQHPALIVTLLVLLPPVGIVLAWLGRWTNRTKTVATVLSALWFVVVMVMDPPEEPGAGDPKPAVTAPATPTPTEEPSTEAPAPTPEPATEAPTTEAPTPTPEPTTEAPTPDPTTPEPTTEAPKPAPTTPKPATPKPKPPAPTTRPAETAEPEPDPAPYYANCTAVRAAGADPIHVGEPGYGRHLDRDGDGVACE
ncbi:excalibur calcium-binding domain-containing protein [Streptomyces filamentosus]|uniref:excalibur calcium-binding domain-containing protein n=1 Tax=Streptomyces filamentosus TaxID=67294 RepID=UPI003321CF1A